jgi:PAS domain-containing protein
MSVSEQFVGPPYELAIGPLAGRTIDNWADAVDGAAEPSLVIDGRAVIAAVSPTACELFGLADPETASGLCLHDAVLPLVDFTAAASPLPDTELSKMPSIQALLSERLARGLLRVRLGDEILTIDAVATPLLENGHVVGSLTFFCSV